MTNKIDPRSGTEGTTPSILRWHFVLVIAVFAFLYGVAVYDYILTNLHDGAYFSYLHYDQGALNYFRNYPPIPLVFWTLNVFGGVATLVAMLFRRRVAFVLSLVTWLAMVLLDLYTFGLLNRWNVIGSAASTVDLSMLALTLGLCLYNYVVFARPAKVTQRGTS